MPWIDTLDNETRAYAAVKGWDRLDGDTAVTTIFKAYQNLEKVRPAPVELPKAAGDYKWDVKHSDGKALEPEFNEFLRTMAFDLKLPVEAGAQLAAKMVAHYDEAELADSQADVERVTTGTAALKTAWGADYEKNEAAAKNAFDALKLPKETVDALVKAMGVDGAMQLGHTLGTRMGEAPMLKGDGSVDNNQQQPALTKEAALARRNQMVEDKAFQAKVASGDTEAMAEFDKVTRAMLGTPEAYTAPPPNFGRTRENPTGQIESFGKPQ
jgi:hypothetical protein